MADNLQVEIYTKFLQQAKLTNVDRETMKNKRGFTDEIINRFKFVSGRKENRKIINNLRDEYEDQVLLNVGILERVNDSLRPCSQLLDDRIIIPYLDESGEKATLLRPHKLGLKGVNIQPYSRFLLKDKPEHVILTEGEFKAVALAQWGIPGFAVPGIQSFSGKHKQRFLDYLKEFEIKRVTIIFDNEVKNDPEFKDKYKEKPKQRWDTPFWAVVMYKIIKKNGTTARLARLPDEWREHGKIDFDGALAQGRTKKDILMVRDRSYTKDEFIKQLPKEGQKIVTRKLAKRFSSSSINREEALKYYEKTYYDKDKPPKRLSNFLIDIKSSFFTSDGVMRQVQFTNENDEKSELFILEPEDMSGTNQFKKFCFSKGGYVWRGNANDLQDVWEFELRRDIGDMIYMPEQIGEIEPNFWLFGNVAIKSGEVYFPDSDGIFWIDSKGYKPQGLGVDSKGNHTNDLPNLYLEKTIDINDVVEKIKHSVGGYEAYVGLGWVIATIFSRVIFNEYKMFPFLFPHGKRGSGKSTFMRWLMAFFGFENEGHSIKESSQNYIMRSLSYVSSLGVWYDEYRNISDVTNKDGYLRSAYNRQVSGKGIKSSFGARSYDVKSTLAISGEELPKDSGLFTRCIPIQMSANKRKREYFDWIKVNKEKFSNFTFHLIKNYSKYKNEILSKIKELKKSFVNQGIGDRAAENWAIVCACFYTVVKKDKEFIKWALKSCKTAKETAEDEHMLNIFWNDIVVLESESKLRKIHLKIYKDVNKEYLAIWFAAAYNIWSTYYRQRTGSEPFDKASILNYIKDEPYYIDSKNVKLESDTRYCIIVDPEFGPHILQELKNSVDNYEKYKTEYS